MRTRRGFTLFEMILSMAMVAMLSSALYMSLTVAFKARDSAQAAVAPVRKASIVMDLIRQDFESVPPVIYSEEYPVLAGPFIGTSQAGGSGNVLSTLTFHTLGRDYMPLDQATPLSEGIRRVEIGVRTDVNPPVLVRRVTRNLLSQTLPEPEEEILCRGVRAFAMTYYDGAAWQTEWDTNWTGDVLPVAVEVYLEIEKPAAGSSSPWFADAQAQTYKIRRVFPLACSKPPPDTSSLGGFLP